MRNYLLIIWALASMVLCQSVFGQDAKSLMDLDSLLNMQGKYECYKKPGTKGKYDDELKSKRHLLPRINVSDSGDTLSVANSGAIVFEHASESYIYVPKRMALDVYCSSDSYILYLDNENGARGAGFQSDFNIHNKEKGIILYAAQGNYSRVKFFIKNGTDTIKTFYLCFLDNAHYSIGDNPELLDTVGLGFKSDTVRMCRKDTIKTLKVIEPKYSVYQSLELNGKKIDQPALISGYNDPESSACIEVDFQSHWDKLKDGVNTVTVNVATFDENCEFAKLQSKTYVIVVEVDNSFPWMWVIVAGVLVLALLALAVILAVQSNKKKILKRLSACKTQICKLQDDKSVPLNAKEQLEGHLQRVTDAITNLSGKKLMKKADKEEHEKLLIQIEEYVKQILSSEDQPDPQPLSNEELLARIMELEDKLSKAEDEKQDALAEQKTKLDELHEKAVKELREQLEQEHKEVLDALNKEHARELADQQLRYQQALDAQKDEYERRLDDQKKSYQEKLDAQREEYEIKLSQTEEACQKRIIEIEAACAKIVANITEELSATKSKWQEDKKYVVNMYKAYENCIKEKVESMRSNADDLAPAYAEILQMHSESVHSFISFHEQFQIIMDKELTITQMREELAKVFAVHIDYERSWINALCRLRAYAQVERLAPVFGLYNQYKEDISTLYMQFMVLANILGFEKIRIPELFAEEFDSATAESDNTNLVLPNIYPDYVEILVSSTIYDLHTIGYTYDGTTRKPKVAYYV